MSVNILSGPSGRVQRFRLVPAPFQQTFKTPLTDLRRFVATSLGFFSPERGELSTDQVVFEPESILQYMARRNLQLHDHYQFTLDATGQAEIAELIEAAMADWIDFLFVPSPEDFAIYADHDEYTTFYAVDSNTLHTLCTQLCSSGFERVSSFRRKLGGDSRT